MSLVTKKAPDFTAVAVMPDNSFKEISLADYRGKHTILFFYPLDFTFVCPTEIIAFDKHLEEFQKLDCQVIGASIDSQYSHWAWKNTPVKKGGIGNIRYPIIADITKQISRDYGVLLEADGVALRGLFLIDKDGVIRHEVVNDLGLGRSALEALRVLNALQHLEKYGEVCPADWHEGEEAMKPTADGVAHYLAEHAT